ncbi:MAG: PhzF family phenazine biosynthesis protein [Candidatus Aminicenantes bacterium]|nr:MAG: PhzF family phenazine biosynthesis protein [Candidatus Aminicenantes bacterium]
MDKLKFYIVDVFAETKLTGNQLAVFINAKSLGTDKMQRIAKEMNFSETTFITSNEDRGNGYDVRIFTPENELPFAGHPTLGTAYVIQNEIKKRMVDIINLNLKVGQIPVSFLSKNNQIDFVWMKLKTPIFEHEYGPEPWTEMLGLEKDDFEKDYPICEVSAGVFCFIVPLKTLNAVKRAQINLNKFYEFIKNSNAKATLVFAKETYKEENDLNVRFFAHYYGVSEDPATGSANGCLAAYLVKYNYFGENQIDVRVEQGYEIGRPSLLLLKAEHKGEDIDINVGGKVFMVAKGEFFI